MAWTCNLATENECKFKAGKNYNSTDITQDRMNEFALQAEGLVNAITRYNWSDDYSSLNEDVKGILSEIVSNLVGVYCISYDMSGFTSRIEAEDMVNILRDGALRGLSILRDKKSQEFLKNA